MPILASICNDERVRKFIQKETVEFGKFMLTV